MKGLPMNRMGMSLNQSLLLVGFFLLALSGSSLVVGQPVPPRTDYPFPTWQPGVISVPPSTTGLTYYVDGRSGSSGGNGNDANAGTSINSALKTISAALKKIVPGDTVLIRGGLYREGIAIYSQATASKPFTFGSYGDGEVILDGSPLVTGWSQVSPSIWRTTWPVSDASQNPLAIIVNEVPLMQNVDGVANVVAGKNNWFYDPNTKLITADMGSVNPTQPTADIIIIRNDPGQTHVFFYDSAYLTFKGLTIRGSGAAGIWGYGSHITIERCNIKFNGKAAVVFFPLGSGATNSDNSVLYTHAYHNAMHNWPRGNNGFAESGGGWSGGIGFQAQYNSIAKGNIVHMTGGEGIIAYGSSPDWVSGNIIFEENVAYDNWSCNMYFDNLPNCVARNNIIYNHPPDPTTWLRQTNVYPWNTLYKATVGLAISDEWGSGAEGRGHYAALININVTGNYIGGCRLGIRDYSEGGEAVANHGLKNVIIRDNTIVIPSPSAYHGMSAVIGIFLQDNGANNYGSFITNNKIYAPPDATVPLVWSYASKAIQGVTINQNTYCSSFTSPFTMDEQDYEISFADWKTRMAQDSLSTLTTTCIRPDVPTSATPSSSSSSSGANIPSSSQIETFWELSFDGKPWFRFASQLDCDNAVKGYGDLPVVKAKGDFAIFDCPRRLRIIPVGSSRSLLGVTTPNENSPLSSSSLPSKSTNDVPSSLTTNSIEVFWELSLDGKPWFRFGSQSDCDNAVKGYGNLPVVKGKGDLAIFDCPRRLRIIPIGSTRTSLLGRLISDTDMMSNDEGNGTTTVTDSTTTTSATSLSSSSPSSSQLLNLIISLLLLLMVAI